MAGFGELSDADLVRLAKTGDSQAFAQLLERNLPKIFRRVHSMLRHTEDAQDVLQECSLKAWRHLHRFEEKAQFSTWLMRIAINEALMLLRKRRRHDVYADLDFEISDPRPSPHEHYARSEAGAFVWREIAGLPQEMQSTFAMRYAHELSTSEMACLLALSEAAVKCRLHRIRRHLRSRSASRRAEPVRRGGLS